MPMTEKEWESRVKSTLKAELARREISYSALVIKLYDIGVTESEASIKNNVSRGRFSAIFFFQCMEAIGVRALQL